MTHERWEFLFGRAALRQTCFAASDLCEHMKRQKYHYKLNTGLLDTRLFGDY